MKNKLHPDVLAWIESEKQAHTPPQVVIRDTPRNRKTWQEYAREALCESTPLMGWLVWDARTHDLSYEYDNQGETDLALHD